MCWFCRYIGQVVHVLLPIVKSVHISAVVLFMCSRMCISNNTFILSSHLDSRCFYLFLEDV